MSNLNVVPAEMQTKQKSEERLELERNIRSALLEVLANPGDPSVRMILADMLEDFREGTVSCRPLRADTGWWEVSAISVVLPDQKMAASSSIRVLSWSSPDVPNPLKNSTTFAVAKGAMDVWCRGDSDHHEYLTASKNTGWMWLCPGCRNKLLQNQPMIDAKEATLP